MKCLSPATSIDANGGGQTGVRGEGLKRENCLNMIVIAVVSNQSSFPVDIPRGFA